MHALCCVATDCTALRSSAVRSSHQSIMLIVRRRRGLASAQTTKLRSGCTRYLPMGLRCGCRIGAICCDGAYSMATHAMRRMQRVPHNMQRATQSMARAASDSLVSTCDRYAYSKQGAPLCLQHFAKQFSLLQLGTPRCNTAQHCNSTARCKQRQRVAPLAWARYERAAHKGCSGALNNLGDCFLHGTVDLSVLRV